MNHDLITDEYLEKMDAYWRATNYLAAAQLYLLDNPLLREPLQKNTLRRRQLVTGEQFQDRTLSMFILTV